MLGEPPIAGGFNMPKEGNMTDYEKLVVSAYTGVLMTDIGDFREYVDEIMGIPITDLDMASKEFWEDLRDRVKPEFLAICADVN